jgi:hypothetical protein
MKNTLDTYLKWLIAITILSFFLPFVLLKIGPLGYENYGPDVSDVYIFGATISGKDKSWFPINFSYKFQMIMMLVYLSLTVNTHLRLRKSVIIIWAQVVNLTLLLLFPLWLMAYSNHVINNSDGADLSIYPHIGLAFYSIGLIINVSIFVKLKKLQLTVN